jgi:hypothetical protein
MICVLVYFFYNHYHYVKYLILGNIVANEAKYSANYQLKDSYLKFWLYSGGCCCCRDKKLTTDQGFVQKMETYDACEKLVSERLSLENFISDGMELQILRGLLLKERHKMLLPVLCINLVKKKDKETKLKEMEDNDDKARLKGNGPVLGGEDNPTLAKMQQRRKSMASNPINSLEDAVGIIVIF